MALQTLVGKLAHPLAEVRQRAAHSIRSKAEASLLSSDDLRLEPNLGRHLLQLAAMDESSPSVKLDALSLIERLAGTADTARQLVQLGAVAELRRVQQAVAAPPPSADAEESSSVDAVAAAAARAMEKILHHPAPELPAVSSPEGQRTPEPAFSSAAGKEAAAAAAANARSRPPLISSARVAAATAGTASASRSLDFANLVAASDDQRAGTRMAAAECATSTSPMAVAYGSNELDAEPRRPAGARLSLPCPAWMTLRCAPLGRSDEQVRAQQEKSAAKRDCARETRSECPPLDVCDGARERRSRDGPPPPSPSQALASPPHPLVASDLLFLLVCCVCACVCVCVPGRRSLKLRCGSK